MSRLHILKRNGEKMKTHYKSQQQKTTTYHWAKMKNTVPLNERSGQTCLNWTMNNLKTCVNLSYLLTNLYIYIYIYRYLCIAIACRSMFHILYIWQQQFNFQGRARFFGVFFWEGRSKPMFVKFDLVVLDQRIKIWQVNNFIRATYQMGKS